MQNSVFNFGWKINYRWFLMMLTAVIPGIIVSIASGQLMWLTASFLAVCGVIPYTASHNSPKFVLLNSLLVCLVAYFLHLILLSGWIWFLFATLILALIAGVIDNMDSELRVLSSWVIIGCVYGAVKLGEYPLSFNQVLEIMLLATASAGLVLLLPLKHPVTKVSLQFIPPNNPNFIFNFKYVIPTLLAVIAWQIFHLHEPEWVIWSALSVTYPEFESALLKFRQRAIAGLIGVSCGLIVGSILPISLWITYSCFILVCLSLKMFKDYFPGYLLRSFCAVVYAANHSFEVALYRIGDVIIGGLIGIISAYFLIEIWLKIRKYKDRII